MRNPLLYPGALLQKIWDLTFPTGDTPQTAAEQRTLTKEEIDGIRSVDGFPLATDEAIMALSDPPYYTACPNPFLGAFIAEHGYPYDEVTDKYRREPFAADVSEGKNDPIYNAHSYHTKVPHKAIMRYILHYTSPGDVVFDGFCGTGMTGVAAHLCGDPTAVQSLGYRVDAGGAVYEDAKLISGLGARKAVLSDLSPAATFIAHNYNAPLSRALLSSVAESISQDIRKLHGWMYETIDPVTGIYCPITFTIWSDVFTCPNCTGEIIFWEAAVDNERKSVRESITCSHCGAENLTKNSLQRVLESTMDVLHNQVRSRAKRIPVLIEFLKNGKRHTKTPDKQDMDLVRRIEEIVPQGFYPDYSIERDIDLWYERDYRKLGVGNVYDFFTRRALLTLSSFRERFLSVRDIRIRSALMWTLTSVIEGSSLMNRERPGGMPSKLSGTLYIGSLIREIDPIAFVVRKTARFAALELPQNNYSIITTQSSTDLAAIPSRSIDYVFTDPPFGSNIIYSDLNILWEGWLGITTATQHEAVVHRRKKNNAHSLSDYVRLMSRAFSEVFRILKPGRWVTVEFHNSQNAVWNAIQEAITLAGFVVADVRTLDKQQSSFKQITAAGAVKADLVISAYKPREGFEQGFKRIKGTEEGAWAFVREHLGNVPPFVTSEGKVEVIAERLQFLLFDRMVAFHLQRGASVPLSAAQFYAGLKQKFPDRDGMYFLETQAAEYDQRRAVVAEVEQLTLYVHDEKSSIQWLHQVLRNRALTYSDIQPRFLQELQQNRYELLPELRSLLQDNFLQDDQGRWYVPDPTTELDKERLRRRDLLRAYDTYKQGRGKLKGVRSEAVRAGFDEDYRKREYAGILAVAARLPEAVLREDSTILTYFDLAQIELE